MNFEQIPLKKDRVGLHEKLKKAKVLEEQLYSITDSKKYKEIQGQIEELYTVNNNELLDYLRSEE